MVKRKATAAANEDNETYKRIIAIVSKAVVALLGNHLPSTEWRTELDAMIPRTIGRFRDDTTCLIRTGPAIWSRYHRNKRLIMVSEYGVERCVESALELAQAFLLPEIERGCTEHGFRQRMSVDPKSSFIYLDLGPLPKSGALKCPQCPLVSFKTTKSLWWHLQCAHKMTHNTAVDEAMKQSQQDRRAMVVFDPTKQKSTLTEALAENSAPPTEQPQQQVSQPHDFFDPWTCAREGHLNELQNHFDIVKLATVRDKRGALLLHWAAGAGHSNVVRFLVQEARTPVDAPQRGHRAFDGRTALHWAARNGHADTVQFLVHQADAQLDAATADGTTAFCWAAWQGHISVLRILHLAGCCVTAENRFGCNAVLWAAQGNATVATIEWLASLADWKKINNAGHGVLHKAAQRGRRDICEWIVKRIQKEKLVELVGPDNDNTVPSDLAGMEGHANLAHYLAVEEMRLVEHADSIKLPDWLTPYSQPPGYLWEEGAGVLRMRSVLGRGSNSTKRIERSDELD